MKLKLVVRLFCFAVAIGLLFGETPAAVSADNVVVVVNKGVIESSLTVHQLKKIILGKTKRWANDKKIKVALLTKGETHKAFLKIYIKKKPSTFARLMKKKAFTLKAFPPAEFNDEKSIIKYVSKTKNSIGYVSSSAKTNKVKVISIK